MTIAADLLQHHIHTLVADNLTFRTPSDGDPRIFPGAF
jgi:hypothetical protein